MALDVQRNWNQSMADNLQSMTSRTIVLHQPQVPQSRDRKPVTDVRPTRSIIQRARQEIHLPLDIVLQVIFYIDTLIHTPGYSWPQKQLDLHSMSLVSRTWNEAATTALYANPRLQGPNYDLFTRTICPSINVSVRKSPLSALVRYLDLSMLVHQGSKSITARLLGRTKGSLERFTAPQSSFSLNCFPALGKCKYLTHLDLSLVSEAANLRTLFDTAANLSKLTALHLPRSAGFGASIDPRTIAWPPILRELTLSGGLDQEFWSGEFHFPDTIGHIRITHCPKLEPQDINHFLFHLDAEAKSRLTKLTLAHLPRLQPGSLDRVLQYFPSLRELSISLDYITPSFLEPDLNGIPVVELPTCTVCDTLDNPVDVWEIDFSEHYFHRMARRRARTGHPTHPLTCLELTDSGDISDPEDLTAIDLMVATEDNAAIPVLQILVVDASIGWHRGENARDLDALNDELVEIVRELRSEGGVRIRSPDGGIRPWSL